MKECSSLNLYIQNSIRENWELLALTDFDGESLQFRGVARKIAKLHLLFEHAGLRRGEKVALCGKNSAQWSAAFLACITYGAVAVPILHEFKPESVATLVNHSDARLFFCDPAIFGEIAPDALMAVEGVVSIADYSLLMSKSEKLTDARLHLNELFGCRYPERFTRDDVVYAEMKPEEPAVINYTSGSTGSPKGVVLSHLALWSNIQYCIDGLTFLKPGDGVVCMLPLAHMFGLTVDLLHCFVKGVQVNFLTRRPTPSVIIEAFSRVKPKLIVTVPLIIEKIIKTKVFPLLEKPLMRLMLMVPFVDGHLLGKIKEKLTDTFGGNLQELIIGGAGLSKDVEEFLRRIRFPFTVGYGMTECGPLIAYAPWDVQRPQSCGRMVDRMEAYVESPDPHDIPGVLWVRGDNVMSGYYKNPEATEAVFRQGWMSTGDICNIDADGFIYIRGRDKNMILGPSGQNIYPEEIEQVLANLPYVEECLVVQRGDRLVALVVPDHEAMKQASVSDQEVKGIMKQNLDQLNHEIPAYAHVAEIEIMDKEFEKTPKRSIKRYLYK